MNNNYISIYENILDHLRGLGPYQIRLFVLVNFIELPVAWSMILPVLVSVKMDWLCPNRNTTITRGYTNITSEHQNVSKSEFEKNICFNGQMCPGVVYSKELTSIVSEWNLICQDDYIGDLITTIQMVGVLLGAIMTGQLVDLFGRRHILFIEYMLLLVIQFGSAFAISWQMFAAMRFFIGCFIGGVLVANYILPIEVITPKWRNIIGILGFWAIGISLFALWGYFIHDWRHLTIATACAGVPFLACWWFVPESPRWLLSHGRIEEAKIILIKMANFNQRLVPDFSQLHSVVNNEKQETNKKKYTYWHLFHSWSQARITVILMYGWFVGSSVYYGMIFNTQNLGGDRYINIFLSGIVEIPAVLFVVAVANRLGRKKTMIGLVGVAGLASFSILFIHVAGRSDRWSAVIIAFAMIGKSGISGGWAAIMLSSAENFPTVIRGLGLAACSMASRIGGVVAAQVIYLRKYANFMPFAIFGCETILFCIFILWIPETTGVPLTDKLSHVLQPAQNLDDLEIVRQGNQEMSQNDNYEAKIVESLEMRQQTSPSTAVK